MTTPEKPLPDVHDPLTAPFWAATRQSKLVLPRCKGCGYMWWPPEIVCPECWTAEREWVEVPAEGTLWSFAVYHRALDPAFADEIPYTVGLIELDAGPKMYGRLATEGDAVQIGQRVTALFRPVNDEVTLVDWLPS